MSKIAKIVTVMAMAVFMGSAVSSGVENAPSLTVVVRNAAGKNLPSAGQIQMNDALAFDSGVSRTAEINEQGTAFFRSEDFKGFMISGLGKGGETAQALFEGSADLLEASFKVQLVFNAEGYVPTSSTVTVPVSESVSYAIDLE